MGNGNGTGGKLIDAHVHFNMLKGNPVEDLWNYICHHELEKVVLIINKREEMTVLSKNLNLIKEFLHKIEFVFGMNRNDRFYEEGRVFCKQFGKKLSLKLHPRLFQIKASEVEWYINEIDKLRPENIVIDDFLYGNSITENIGLELICTIAEKFPQIKIIMAHAGGVNLLNHVMQTKTYQNIYYDISLTCNYLFESSIQQDLVWLLKYMGARIMLGSDYPDFHIGQAKDNVESLREQGALDERAWEQIIFGNAAMIYGR